MGLRVNSHFKRLKNIYKISDLFFEAIPQACDPFFQTSACISKGEKNSVRASVQCRNMDRKSLKEEKYQVNLWSKKKQFVRRNNVEIGK